MLHLTDSNYATTIPSVPSSIVKRDGRIVRFDPTKIHDAIYHCFQNSGIKPSSDLWSLTSQVTNIAAIRTTNQAPPSVESVQDTVEIVLQSAGEYEAAKQYILYRADHAKRRKDAIPTHIQSSFDTAQQFFPTPIQEFQFFDKYSRFNYDLGRRETWPETVERAIKFLYHLVEVNTHTAQGNLGIYYLGEITQQIRSSILNMQAMPAMRLLAMAGPAAERNNAAIYNCSYMPVADVTSFCEALWLSMSGCGVGFSVESQYVDNFPKVARQTGTSKGSTSVLTMTIEDSTEGWYHALKVGMDSWIAGHDIKFDYSLLRPAGAVLRTKGGRSSGPGPLKDMLDFVRTRILSRQGTNIRPIDAHDIMCKVGNAAVSGGVRRTAMISLFDYDDCDMLHAKDAGFDIHNNQRWNANNSAVWPERGINQLELVEQFTSMIKGQSGEPGIFNRTSSDRLKPARRASAVWGTNPCGEVILRPYELCNLSIAVARHDDTLDTLRHKVEVATIIGTIQSLATDFPMLRPEWSQNCQEERLLGVDITGQLDCPLLSDPQVMQQLRETVLDTNLAWSVKFGINQSAATTVVKPSGNSSQLLNTSSGLHARHAPYYERNVRVSATSPVYKVLRDAGAPMSPENGQSAEDANTYVVHFVVQSPPGTPTRKDRTAIEQCNYWLHNKLNWTEHNPSVTITYRPDEVVDLIKWVWDHHNQIGGMAFLPEYDAVYEQLPYIEISKKDYEARAGAFPQVDYARLYKYESTDLTNAASEMACLAGQCDL